MANRAKSPASPRNNRKRNKTTKPPRRTRSMAQGTALVVREHRNQIAVQSQASISDVADQVSARAMMERFHPNFVGNLAYMSMCEGMGITGDFLEAAVPSLIDFQEQMHPTDPLLALALTQALIAHGRAAWLAKLAAAQTNPKSLCLISEASGRASHTFARLMNAILQYRRPAATTTVSIAQANLAGQQVVQNVLNQEDQNHSDQTRIGQSGPASTTAALSPDGERPALVALNHQKDAAVEEKHRPTNVVGKVTRRDERAKARRAVSCKNRVPQADEGND
jgi:hypothetical protein